VAFADADASENPLIRSVDHFFEVGVGEKAGRHVGAEGADFCPRSWAQGLRQFVQLELLMKGNQYSERLTAECLTQADDMHGSTSAGPLRSPEH
jgi:hypothetical protein